MSGIHSHINLNVDLTIRIEVETHKKSGQDILVYIATWQQYKTISYISFDDALEQLKTILNNIKPSLTDAV